MIFVRISANVASVRFVSIPVSLSHSGPEKFLSSSDCGPVSLIRPIDSPLNCFAFATADAAIGSRACPTPVEALMAASACSELSQPAAAAAAAAASPVLIRKSLRAMRSRSKYSSCETCGS